MHEAFTNSEDATRVIISEIAEACEKVAEQPPQVDGKRDEIVAMMARSLLDVLHDPDLKEEQEVFAKGVLDCRGQERAQERVVTGKLVFDYFRCVCNFRNYMPSRENGYPWTDQKTWDEYVRDDFFQAKKAPGQYVSSLDDFAASMLIMRNSTNEPRRIAGAKLASLVILGEERCASGINMASIGASLGRGIGMLARNETLHVDVYDPTQADPTNSPIQEEIVNHLLEKPVHIKEGLCIDLMNPRLDADFRLFAKACCYPGELLDNDKQELLKRVDRYMESADNITYIGSFFGLPEKASRELIAQQQKGKIMDATDASAMLHQNPLKVREAIFDDMTAITRDDGLIVISEFVDEINPTPRHPIDRFTTIGPTAKPYTFTTWVYDMQQPDKGLQLFFTWDSGRCARVWIHDAAIQYYKQRYKH